MAAIIEGTRVLARTADGQTVERRAVTGIVAGHDFPVVWVCQESEWSAAKEQHRSPIGLPWPADAVEVR